MNAIEVERMVQALTNLTLAMNDEPATYPRENIWELADRIDMVARRVRINNAVG